MHVREHKKKNEVYQKGSRGEESFCQRKTAISHGTNLCPER